MDPGYSLYILWQCNNTTTRRESYHTRVGTIGFSEVTTFDESIWSRTSRGWSKMRKLLESVKTLSMVNTVRVRSIIQQVVFTQPRDLDEQHPYAPAHNRTLGIVDVLSSTKVSKVSPDTSLASSFGPTPGHISRFESISIAVDPSAYS
jgi:hypothetical protein